MSLTIIFLTDRCDQIFLEALKAASFADKIIIFDYQSQNDWQRIKKTFPKTEIKVIEKKEKISDFAAARNEAITLVETEWLLFLDSDEVLEEKEQKKIGELLEKESNDQSLAAFLIKREDFFHKQKINWGETKNVFLARLARTKKISFKRAVHEEVVLDGKSQKTDIKIKHFAHQSVSEFFSSISNYAEIEADYRVKNNWHYSKFKIILEAVLFPIAKFIDNYFLKLGTLDGFAGLVYAALMSCHSLMVRVYLYEKIFSK